MATGFSSCNMNNKKTKAIYEGEDVSGFAGITRDKKTKVASITVNEDGKWKLYAGSTTDEIDFNLPLAEGSAKGKFHLDVPGSSRSYFQLETGKGKAILAERHLPMEGGYNFRDLGGIRNKDGKYTKWGRILRSDDLHKLTGADLKYLSSIPVTSIVDFRSEQEMEAAPDKVPANTVKDYIYSINPGNLANAVTPDMSNLASLDMDSVMRQINVMLVSDRASINRYRDFFGLLQSEENMPLMFHCSAGKDRTGMGAALVLFALGVDEDRIMEDYLLSNKYIGEKYAEYTAQYPQLKPLFEVKPEFIGAGIAEMKNKYGSVENYLEEVLDVDIERFRDIYLY